MVLLAQHQEWQQKARDEIIQVFEMDNKPNFDGLSHLKIVTMILNEVLRLYPSVIQINRCINEDIKLGESLHLPAGTLVSLPVILLHHDKRIWGDDSKEFKPERFAEGIFNVTKDQHCYFPFSSAPRVCIGQNFALGKNDSGHDFTTFLIRAFTYLHSFPLGVVAWWGWGVLGWIWLKPKRMEKHLRNQGYHGNPYKFLFGDLKELSALHKHACSTPISLEDDIVPRVAPFLHKTINTYGRRTFMWLGHIPRVHILEPELAREVLSKNFNYLKPKTNPLSKLVLSGLISYDLDKWVKHRKIINPAFHMEKLKLMLPAFHVSCVEMISGWEKAMEESKEVDVWPFIQTLSADVISRTAFGSSYEEGRKIFQLLKIQAELLTQVLSSIYIPGWRFLPTRRNIRMKSTAKELHNLLANLINKRIKNLKAREATNEDLLSILLESNFKDVDEHHKDKYEKMVGMTIKEIVEECKLFYFAGQETTATLLIWTMILLAQHQEWQQQARDEVLQIFGKDNQPNFDGLSHLKIVTMILNEVLRLYPPIIQLNRSIMEDTKLGESLHLQVGSIVTVQILLIHHDKKIWGEDAKEFKPERFAEGVSKATKGQHSYFPFSSGPRVCIGQNFAMYATKMAMVMILRNFSFELSPSYTHAPQPIIPTKPQFGAPLIMHKL